MRVRHADCGPSGATALRGARMRGPEAILRRCEPA